MGSVWVVVLGILIVLGAQGQVEVVTGPRARVPDSITLSEMRKEVERLMPIHLEWDTEEDFWPTQVVVVTWAEHLDKNPERALGWTASENGEIFPFIYMDGEAVKGMVERVAAPVPENVGRALGRVLAHELFHVITRTKEHGMGIMRSRFSAEDLVWTPFHFTVKQKEQLLEGVLR